MKLNILKGSVNFELHREMRVRHNNLKNLKDMLSLFQEKVNEKLQSSFLCLR